MGPGIFVLLAIVAIVVIVMVVSSMNSDARIKKNGTTTTGTVLNTETFRTTDMYGRVSTSYYLSYDFTDAQGRRVSNRKQVYGSLAGKKKGDSITVYYLPDRPDRNTVD